MEKKNQVPKYPPLRFPEFTDEWTQTTIGEICKVSTGEMNTQDKIEDGMYPFYVRSSKIERANRYTYDGVAILTPGDGAIGQIFHYSKGKIAVHQRVYMLTEMQCIPKYLFHCFSARFFGRVNRMSAKNTVDSVRMNMITDMPIPLPSLPEQRKIAALLSLIDERIEVQNAIIKEREAQKAALLRRLFDRTLRFPEFTDEWKEVKLGEVAERIKKRNTGHITRVLTISAQYGLVEQEDFFSKRVSSVDLSNYFLVEKGEFAYNKSYSRGYPWGTIKRLDQYDSGVLSPLYIGFRLKDDGIDSDYLQQYFEGSQWHKKISLIAMEGARNHGLLNITIQDFFNLPLRLPSLPEQKKIAALLSAIDERLDVERAYAEQLRQQKAYLLRQMFI